MPELLFQPKTRGQLAWLLCQAKEQGIPYREFVKPRKTVSASPSMLDELSEAGKHAKMIASGKMEGKNAYDLLNEL